jgi:hypothetical protein
LLASPFRVIQAAGVTTPDETMNDSPACPTGAPAAPDAPNPPAPSASRTRHPEYALYKPNRNGTGGVMRFGLNPLKNCLFVDAASQCGERQFDWESKITMKWGLSDLGAALAALQGHQPEIKLFHRSERANSAFGMSRRQDPDKAPWLLSLSRQDQADKSVRKVTIPLTHAEAAVLETALRRAVARLLGW